MACLKMQSNMKMEFMMMRTLLTMRMMITLIMMTTTVMMMAMLGDENNGYYISHCLLVACKPPCCHL